MCAPASEHTVCLFVAFLAPKLEYITILNYTAAVVSLHHFRDFAPPDMKRFAIKQALPGVQRERSELPFQRTPIGPKQLQRVFGVLDKLDPAGKETFWAACISAFFSLARSANLFKRDNNGTKHLLVRDSKINS